MVQKFHASLPPVCNNAFFFWFVPGKAHERQRKIMAPIFFASQLKVYLPIFQDAASKVCTVFPLGIISPISGVLDDDDLPFVLTARSKVER